ncbi:SNF2-related [Trypanosoma melophagium]|uniref:SNF2-related n=1 Tax=Trypanosoma melophagium TaxID=715481 RepID=UPI003519FF55|nr:SNF2-related [Trypanosoma melophagium]
MEVTRVHLDRSNTEETTEKSSLIIPVSLESVLRPHQISALHFLWRKLVDEGMERIIHNSRTAPLTELVQMYQEMFGCIIGHSMGLGKTVTVLSFLLLLQRHYAVRMNANTPTLRVLVLTPRSCTYQWQSCCAEWMRQELFGDTTLSVYAPLGSRSSNEIILNFYKTGGILLLGYEEYQKLLRQAKEKLKGPPLCNRIPSLFDYARPPLPFSTDLHLLEILESPDVVVHDESHRLKRLNSKLVIELTEHLRGVQLRVALTGTPLQNHLEEYNVMYAVVTGAAMDPAPFRRLFTTPIERGQCVDSTVQQFTEMQRCVASLRKFFSTTVHHCGPEVLERELPTRREYVILVGLSPKQEEVYRAMLTRHARSGNNRIILALHHEASHVCCHPTLTRRKAHELMHFTDQITDVGWTRNDGDKHNHASRSRSPSLSTYHSLSSSFSSSASSYSSYSSSSFSSSVYNSHNKSSSSSSCSSCSSNASSYSSSSSRRSTQSRSRSSSFLSAKASSLEMTENNNDNNKEEEEADPDSVLQRLDIAESPKLALALSLVHHINENLGEKVVLFSIYRSHLFLLSRLLHLRHGLEAEVLHGGLDVRDRQRIIEEFTNNESRRVLLCSTKASGVGINLVTANHCILFDVSWNPADDTQATYRLYRYGQKRPVTVYRIATAGTFEHVVFYYALSKSWLHKKIVDVADPTRYERHMKDNYFIYPCGLPVDFGQNGGTHENRTGVPNSNFIQQRWREYAEHHCPALALTAPDGTFKWIRSIAEHSFLLRDNTEEVIREMSKRFEMEKKVSRLPVFMPSITLETQPTIKEYDSPFQRCESALQTCFTRCARQLVKRVKKQQKQQEQEEKEGGHEKEVSVKSENGKKSSTKIKKVLCKLFAAVLGLDDELTGGIGEILMLLFHRGVDDVMKNILGKSPYAKIRSMLNSRAAVDSSAKDSLQDSLRYRPFTLFARMSSSEVAFTLTEMGFVRLFVPHCTILGTKLALKENKATPEVLQTLNSYFTLSNELNTSDPSSLESMLVRYLESFWPPGDGLQLQPPPYTIADIEAKEKLTERAYRTASERTGGFLTAKEAAKFIDLRSVRGRRDLYHCKRCNDGLLDRTPPDLLLKCTRCHYSAEFDVQTHITTRHACVLYQLSVMCELLDAFSISRSFTTAFVPRACRDVLQVLRQLRQTSSMHKSRKFIAVTVSAGVDVLLRLLSDDDVMRVCVQCGVAEAETLRRLLAADSNGVWSASLRTHVRRAVTEAVMGTATIKTTTNMTTMAMPEMLIRLGLQSMMRGFNSGETYAKDVLLGGEQTEEASMMRFICDGLVKLNYAERLLANPLSRALLDAVMMDYDSPSDGNNSTSSDSDKNRNVNGNKHSSHGTEKYEEGGESDSSASVSIASVARRVRAKKRQRSPTCNSSPCSSFSPAQSSTLSSFNSCYSDEDDDDVDNSSNDSRRSRASVARNAANRAQRELMESEEVLRLRSVHYWAAYCEVYGTCSMASLTVMIEDEENGMCILPPPPNSFWVSEVKGGTREGMQLLTVFDVFLEKIMTLSTGVRVIK